MKTNVVKSIVMLSLCFVVLFSGLLSTDAHAFEFSVNSSSDGVTITNNGNDIEEATLVEILGKYRSVAMVGTGALAVTAIIILFVQITKLGAAGDNPVARKRALMGIMMAGIGIAIMGGSTVAIGILWNLFPDVTTTTTP